MSSGWQMSVEVETAIEMLKDGKILFCEHVHQPLDDGGKPAIWTDAIRGSGAQGWFEPGGIIRFWGRQDYTALLDRLKKSGIRTWYFN